MANVEHSTLTGTDLHESKGVAAAANNRVFVTNGAGSGSFQQVPAAAIVAAGILVFQSQKWHGRDERSSGTGADTLTNNTWNTRTLQTEKTDDLSITLSGNQISLVAGTYWCEATASVGFETHGGTDVFQGFAAQSRLRNVTDSTTLLNGVSAFHQVEHQGTAAQGDLESILHTFVSGQFTLAGTKTIELQTWPKSQGTGTTTFVKGGIAVSSGENEVYADVKIWKLS
jgi:hypothetical protein